MKTLDKLQKIMHVEDDTDILEITKIILGTLSHYEVAQCISGIEALKLAPEFKPDLFILDAIMMGMSGLETLSELRKIPEFRRTPVIFMTVKAQDNEIQELMDAGAIQVITKPFDPITLTEKIMLAWKTVGE